MLLHQQGSAASRSQCLRQYTPQVPKAHSCRSAAQQLCSSRTHAGPPLQVATAAAAAGNSDSCSICGVSSSSSLEQQREQQQPPWQPKQSPVVQQEAADSSTSSWHASEANTLRPRGQRPSAVNGNGSSSSNPRGHGRQRQAEQEVGNQQLAGAAIMRQLKAAGSWQELQQVMQQHGAELNWRHSSAIITHVAQLSAQQQQQQEAGSVPLQQQEQHQTETQPPPLVFEQQQRAQQLADSLPAAVDPGGPLAQQAAADDSSRQASTACGSCTDPVYQEFVQSSVMPCVDLHLQSYDARGLANCIWAVAKLQAVAQPSSNWLQQFCSTSQPLLGQFDAQQLSNMLWGLVQLQHAPPQAWMQGWYAAMLQACRADDPDWQPQSVSSALWALAQLYGDSSSSSRAGAGPSSTWLHQLLSLAMQRVAAPPASEPGSSSSSSGQVVSNLLWSCVLLHQSPGTQVLRALCAWLEQLLAAQTADAAAAAAVAAAAAAAAALSAGSADAPAAADAQQQQLLLSDQSLANCMWALGKLYQRFEQDLPVHEARALRQQGQAYRRGTRPAVRQFKGLICGAGKLLLQLSQPRLAATSSQHLSNLLWGAGALRLELDQPQQVALEDAVAQQLVVRAGSLTDQQVSNLLWGLSQVKQQQQQVQQQQLQRQHQQQAECIEQLLLVQVGRLQGFSSQAIGSSLLSLARMQHRPSDDILHAWLHALSSRALVSRSDLVAAVDACVALSLLQEQQAAAAASSASARPWSSSSSGSSQADGQWLQALCTATVGRLGAFSADQLCALGKAMTVLRFRAPVPWLSAWAAAVVAKADGSMPAAMAARVLSVMQALPGAAALGAAALQAARARLADEAVSSVTAAAAAGRASAEDLAAAALCVAAVRSGSSEQGMQHVLAALPSVLSSCSTRQLAEVLSAAAAMQAPLPPGLLRALLQEAQRKQHGQAPGTGTLRLLVALAKVSHHQQQQLLLFTTEPAQPGAVAHEQQQQEDLVQQQQEQQAVWEWLTQTVPQLQLQLAGASASYLSATVWALAVLCFHPGRGWLDAWVQHSMRVLQEMEPQQLASCGWALTVLRYRPAPQWLALWSQAVAQHAAAAVVQPRSLALLLYSSASLGCPVNSAWLRSVGMLAARQAGSWTAADVADGLWGLGQLGLRAVADEEVLELLLGRLVEATAAQGQLRLLGPHRQLQVLQAALLLGPGPDRGQKQVQQQQQQLRAVRDLERRAQLEQRLKARRRRLLRWFSWRAWSSAAAARAAAAVAAQQQGANRSGSFSDSSSSSSGGGGQSRKAVAALVSKAAVVAAEYVQIKTGRDPAAAAGADILSHSWFEYWCRCSILQLQHWRPQQVAAALAAFAALGWQPPLAWQQQMLEQVTGKGQLSAQTACAIQDALVALGSPLVHTWMGSLAVQYVPAGRGSSQSGSAAAPAPAAAEQWQRVAAPSQQQQQQPRKQAVGSGWAGVTGSSSSRAQQPSYPHHLRGNVMRRLQRRQHLTRLVGWWRQQQVMQQQYAQQRQQQEEEMWRAAAAAAGVGSYSGSLAGSSLSSMGGTPSASVDGGTAAAVPATGSGGAPVAGPAPRRLDGSLWGRQLLRPPPRPAAASPPAAPVASSSSSTDVSSSSVSSSSGSSSSSDATAPNVASPVEEGAVMDSTQATAVDPLASPQVVQGGALRAAVGGSSSTGSGQAVGVVQQCKVVRPQAAAAAAALPVWDSWAAAGQQVTAGEEGPVFVYGAGRQMPGSVLGRQ